MGGYEPFGNDLSTTTCRCTGTTLTTAPSSPKPRPGPIMPDSSSPPALTSKPGRHTWKPAVSPAAQQPANPSPAPTTDEGYGSVLVYREPSGLRKNATPLSVGEGDGQDVQADDTVEVPEVCCPDTPSGSNGGRRDDPVMRPHLLAGSGQSGPDAGVRASSQQAEGQRGKRGQHRLDEGLPAGPVLGSGAVHAMQQLGGRDGGDPYLLIGP